MNYHMDVSDHSDSLVVGLVSMSSYETHRLVDSVGFLVPLAPPAPTIPPHKMAHNKLWDLMAL